MEIYLIKTISIQIYLIKKISIQKMGKNREKMGLNKTWLHCFLKFAIQLIKRQGGNFQRHHSSHKYPFISPPPLPVMPHHRPHLSLPPSVGVCTFGSSRFSAIESRSHMPFMGLARLFYACYPVPTGYESLFTSYDVPDVT